MHDSVFALYRLAMDARGALEKIAAPVRADGSWNHAREACRQIAADALARYDDVPVGNPADNDAHAVAWHSGGFYERDRSSLVACLQNEAEPLFDRQTLAAAVAAERDRLRAAIAEPAADSVPLYVHPPRPTPPTPEPELLKCDISARPLRHPLSDYHYAMSEGPLHYTWIDKPHRLVYDLIAAVRYYAEQSQEVPPPRPSPPRLTDEAIDAIFDAHEEAPTMSYRYWVARAVESAVRRQFGVEP